MSEIISVDYVAEHIKELVDDGYQLCIWGTEEKAAKLGVVLLGKCGVLIQCYCDEREEKWGKEIVKDKFCIAPDELKRNADNYICVVMVNDVDTLETVERLRSWGVKYCCGFYDLLCSEYALHCFYPFTAEPQSNPHANRIPRSSNNYMFHGIENRIAVYTCVIGGYDNVYDPQIPEDNCDYYIISESKPKNISVYQWIPLDTLDIPMDLNNVLINRFCKINAHKMFPQYKYSIYIDGNIELKRKISNAFLKKLEGKVTGIACKKRNCKIADVYRDGIHVIVSRLADEIKVQKQMEQYWKEGLPEYHGQIAGNIWVREHNNPACIRIMEEWWNQISTQAPRDQLSFMYAVWKNGYCFDDIGILDVGGWHNETYDAWKHVKGYGK